MCNTMGAAAWFPRNKTLYFSPACQGRHHVGCQLPQDRRGVPLGHLRYYGTSARSLDVLIVMPMGLFYAVMLLFGGA